MKFTKVQGSGNDFILIEANEEEHNWSRLAVAMCSRHFGIGADSLLVVSPSLVADFKMRVFDYDGSEASACGNGLLCLVKYAFRRGLVKTSNRITVETISGIRRVELDGSGDKITSIRAGMGRPEFKADDIPVIIEAGQELVDIKSMLCYPITVEGVELKLNLVSMGNPHAVFFWPRPVAEFPLSQLGPRVEHLPIFPDRVNFEVARVVSRKQIEARVWERGVGETLACGSGACAIVVAAQLYGYIGEGAEVKLPGGVLKVTWDGVGEVFLSGAAEIVFDGEWPDEALKTD